MAAYNNIKLARYKPPITLSLDECDVCGSDHIVEDRTGYICRDCGVVLEIQKLEYHNPYESSSLQHSILDRTQIGFWKERRVMSNSVHVERLNKLDAIRENEETIKRAALVEIRRILTGLQFSLQEVPIIYKKFQKIRSQLGKGTKYRAPEKLIPCVIYFHYKAANKPIHQSQLLELTTLSKKEFNNFKLQMLEMWPNYQERNRQEYILRRLFGLCEHFGLGMTFYHQSKKILYKLYDSIKNTKDSVIVGLISSIILLCSGEEEIRVSNICDHLEIRMSTIQTQVERRIFKQFNVGGYVSLIRSKDILKRIMIKLDILDPRLMHSEAEPEQKYEEEGRVPEKLYRALSLGSALPIFTLHDNKDYYSLLVETKTELLVSLISKSNSSKFEPFIENEDHGKMEESFKHKTVHIELWKYQYPVGPPLVCA
ncbi:MAG: TFIIB-type zinc ribbon-containing protein [Candidatus Thorarchaeota archaeon]